MIKKRNIDVDTRLRDLGEWLKFDLTAGVQNAFALAVQNPYTKDLIITRVIVRTTTGGGTASATLDIGTAANATTTAQNIFEAIDIASAVTGIYDSLNDTDNGTAGVGKSVIWNAAEGAADYLTAQILDAAASELVGKVYIHVIEAQ